MERIREAELTHHKTKQLTLCISILCIGLPLQAAATPICKEVGKNWVWFGEHAVSSIEYVVAFDKNESSEIRVGTGIFIGGKPRGQIQGLVTEKQINAYGIGAIHVRNKAEKKVKVCVTTGNISAISLYSDNF